jgi:hypothetical protein
MVRPAVGAGLAITGSVLASAPATAKPIDKGHFHDVFTSDVYDCDGTQAQDGGDVSGNFVFNQRGSSAFPYFRESVRGTIVTTNLENDCTYTNVFTANSRDHTIVNNGDGTITITTFASAAPAFMTPTASSCFETPASSGSPSTSTTTAHPATPTTTSRSPTRSGSCATPPGATTSKGATSARTSWSSPLRSPAPKRHAEPEE